MKRTNCRVSGTAFQSATFAITLLRADGFRVEMRRREEAKKTLMVFVSSFLRVFALTAVSACSV